MLNQKKKQSASILLKQMRKMCSIRAVESKAKLDFVCVCVILFQIFLSLSQCSRIMYTHEIDKLHFEQRMSLIDLHLFVYLISLSRRNLKMRIPSSTKRIRVHDRNFPFFAPFHRQILVIASIMPKTIWTTEFYRIL